MRFETLIIIWLSWYIFTTPTYKDHKENAIKYANTVCLRVLEQKNQFNKLDSYSYCEEISKDLSGMYQMKEIENGEQT